MNSHIMPGCLSLASSLFLAGLTSAAIASAATPVQEMSRTVETLCPPLKAAYTANPQSLTQAEQDVLFRCGELKLAAGQSFANLSEAQRTGLGYMTSDETSAMGTTTVALSGAQNIAILGRLAGLRGKTTGSLALHDRQGTTPPASLSGPDLSLSSQTKAMTLATDGDTLLAAPFETAKGYVGNFSQMSDYGKWGFFMNGNYGGGNKDATSLEPGFDFDSWGLVSGLDYRLSDQFVLGLALSYAATRSSIDNNAGDVDLDGFGGSFYGTYYHGSFYVDFLAGAATKGYDTERNVAYSVAAKTGGVTRVDQRFTGSTDATDVNLGIGTGYNFAFGGLALTPFINLSYLESNIDGYTENLQGQNSNAGFGLALRVDDQEIKSLASSLGAQLAYAVNTPQGVLTPYVRADWEHEFENDARNLTAHFATVRSSYDALNTITIPTDDPDRDFVNLAAGVSAVLPGGWQCFFDYSTVLGYEDITLHRVVAGVRLEF